MSLMFFGEIVFSQNTITYSALTKTIDLNSGVEGTVDILVNCYGSSPTPMFLNTMLSCGNNDGILSQSYTNGSVLTPGQNTTLRYKFKKSVATDTQVVYKFSTNGSCFQDEKSMIRITVNYKKESTTTPPVIPPGLIYMGFWPNTNVTINEGSLAPLLTGKGGGGYTHQWYKIENGKAILIPGETYYYYSPGTPFVTTKYFRENITGSKIGRSNEVTITVIPAPKIENNTISISGSEIQGSIPTGGIGEYKYRWLIYALEGEIPGIIDQNTKNFSINPATYNFVELNNVYIERAVYSGGQYSVSNYVLVSPAQEIINNIITLSGNNIVGTIPSGGTGKFEYYYEKYDEFEGEGIDGVHGVGHEQNYYIGGKGNGGLTNKYWRTVISGNKTSRSNIITIPPWTTFLVKNSVTNKEAAAALSDSLVMYPNPTSDAVNFVTGFSENRAIELVVYSENMSNKITVFKGTVTPNQVVKWNIPTHYKKGLYYYKIMSDNQEVKSGKIIYQ